MDCLHYINFLFTVTTEVYFHYFIGLDKQKQKNSVKMYIFSYPSVLTYVFGAQKDRLIETVLLSTHKICFC